MTKKQWGNIIWVLFHTLAYKLKQTESAHAPELLKIFIDICHRLPCPYCRSHAIEILGKANTKIVKTRADLIRFTWQFHNIVNKKLGKREILFDEINKKYEDGKVYVCMNEYIGMISRSTMTHFALSDSVPRNQHRIKIINYFQNNKHRFLV